MRWWGWLLRRPASAAKLSGVTDSWACASSSTRISGALFSSLPCSLSLCSRALIASRLEARKAAARALHTHKVDDAPQIGCLAATRHTALSASWRPCALHFSCSLNRAHLLARTRASSRASPARESQFPSAWLAANTSRPQRTARSRICHSDTRDSRRDRLSSLTSLPAILALTSLPHFWLCMQLSECFACDSVLGQHSRGTAGLGERTSTPLLCEMSALACEPRGSASRACSKCSPVSTEAVFSTLLSSAMQALHSTSLMPFFWPSTLHRPSNHSFVGF